MVIKPITKSDLNDCLNVLRMGFEDNAIRFSLTNSYRGRTQVPLSVLEKELLEGCQCTVIFTIMKLSVSYR